MHKDHSKIDKFELFDAIKAMSTKSITKDRSNGQP